MACSQPALPRNNRSVTSDDFTGIAHQDRSAQIDQVDVRGPRFAAWVTTAVLVITLVVSSFSLVAAAVILGVQAVVFAIGALGGPRKHPYGLIFAKLVAPRLAPVTEREPVPPLKFAQLVGFVFAVVGVVGFATGLSAHWAWPPPRSRWSPRSSTPPSPSASAASSIR